MAEFQDEVTGEFKQIRINIWDTCGAEIYRAITRSYIRDSDAVLVAFSITEKNSLQKAKEIILDLKNSHNKLELAKVFLIGNKVDKREQEFSNERTLT